MDIERRRVIVRKSQAKRRARFATLGLCIQCGKTPPESGKTLCRACLDKQAKASMKYRKGGKA